MAVLQECPACHWKGSVKKKTCPACGQIDFDKAKKSQKIKFWIQYRDENKKQHKEYIGTSISEARDADSKKKVLKRERRPVFDILPESKMTFSELARWYLELEKVKDLKSYWHVETKLNQFNKDFGEMIVRDIQPADLENLQVKRRKAGKAPATVDHEIGAVKTMIRKAFENRKVGGEVLQTVLCCKKILKRGSDVRDRVLSMDEYETLYEKAPMHIKPIIAMGFYTGMRRGEIVQLTWDRIDMKARRINLTADMTKDKEARSIPICDALLAELKKLPRPLPTVTDQHVFKYKGKPVRDFRAGLKKACKDAGILYGRFEEDGFIFHDLRHSFVTNSRKAGVAESVIMAITGHSTREMFDRYNAVDHDDTAVAVTQLESYLGNVTQDVTQAGNF